jgi:hypothetical protein
VKDFRYWLPFATFGGAFLATNLIASAVVGTALVTPFKLAIDLAVPAVGLLVWVRSGHSWLASASWTLPLAIALVAADQIDELPGVVRLPISVAGTVFGVVMIMEPDLATWWYRRILRSEPPPRA